MARKKSRRPRKKQPNFGVQAAHAKQPEAVEQPKIELGLLDVSLEALFSVLDFIDLHDVATLCLVSKQSKAVADGYINSIAELRTSRENFFTNQILAMRDERANNTKLKLIAGILAFVFYEFTFYTFLTLMNPTSVFALFSKTAFDAAVDMQVNLRMQRLDAVILDIDKKHNEKMLEVQDELDITNKRLSSEENVLNKCLKQVGGNLLASHACFFKTTGYSAKYVDSSRDHKTKLEKYGADLVATHLRYREKTYNEGKSNILEYSEPHVISQLQKIAPSHLAFLVVAVLAAVATASLLARWLAKTIDRIEDKLEIGYGRPLLRK